MPGARAGAFVWLEPGRAHSAGQWRTQGAFPEEERLAQVLAALPQGPTAWIIDDLWAPALLLKDLVEVPAGAEARENFLHWRYAQYFGFAEPQHVQALDVEESAWLLVGMPQSLRESWLQLALRLKRPIHALVPRWLWLYNRLAPTRSGPGMLLSLCLAEGGGFHGTLAAWGRTLTLLRQWHEPLSPEAWMEERVLPTAAFLQREEQAPRELLVWGSTEWPEGILPVQCLPAELSSLGGR